MGLTLMKDDNELREYRAKAILSTEVELTCLARNAAEATAKMSENEALIVKKGNHKIKFIETIQD